MAVLDPGAGAKPAREASPPDVARMLDALPVAAYVCDLNGRITHYNEHMVALCGRAPALHEPAVNRCDCKLHALVPSEDTPALDDPRVLAPCNGGDPQAADGIIARPDGSRRIVRVHARPLHDTQGVAIGAIHVLVDETDARRTELDLRQRVLELQQRERDLEDFFDDSAIPIHCVDSRGVVLRVNKAELDLLGYSAEEYVGQPMARFYADTETAMDVARRLMRGETLRGYEARLLAKDGSIKHVSITSNVYWEAGQFKHTRCFSVDVTAERTARAALKASETNFRSFFDNVAIGAAQVDADGRYLSVNDRYCEITGYSREELLAMSPLDLDHPDDRAADLERVIKAMRTPGAAYHAEKRYIRKDGSTAWVQVAANLVRDAQGKPLHTAAVVEDITERKLAEQALEETDRLKDEFLATLAHELRNPLAPLRSAVELMRYGTQEHNDWCRDMMGRQITHLTRLIDDLLDVSRITSDRLVLDRRRIALAEALDAAIEASNPMLEQCHQTLSVSAAPEPLYLDGDLVRLTQVFTNLLTNAAKFTDGPGTIRLSAARVGAVVRIGIADSGIGMSKHDLDRIFEKFYQVPHSTARTVGGLGIGLSLVKRLVELHGGSVEARSPGLGLGSEVVVRLPLADPAASAPHAPAEHEAGARRRVLVVDDNRDAADALAHLLEVLGHQTATVYDGAAALERARPFQPDLVLLDLGMPGLDGYETCRQLRLMSLDAPPRIVALTGWGREQDLARTRAAGFDGHLIKPVDAAALQQLLQRAQCPGW